MTTKDYGRDTAIQRARDFYSSQLSQKLESAALGKYVVIDGNSLDYEVDASMIVATVHLQDRQPDAMIVVFKTPDDLDWLTRPRRDASRLGRTVGEFNEDFSERNTPPEISLSSASLEAENFYNTELRAQLELVHTGKYILIAGDTHDYEIDDDPIVAGVHLLDRQPDAEMFMFCIGCDSGQFALHGFPISVK